MTKDCQPPGLPAPVWLWPNLLGLDAPLVAVSWQLLFSRCFDVRIPHAIHLLLGLSVWCVYLADRLYDVYRAKDFVNATWRLRFTKQYFTALALTTAVAGAANLCLIIRFAPMNLLIHGMITAGLLAGYYVFRFSSSEKLAAVIPREIMCGMIFATGSATATYSFAQPQTIGFSFLGAVVMLGIVCSASCIWISVWERDADLASGDHSIVSENVRIPSRIRRLLLPLAALCGVLAFTEPWQIHVAACLSALALYLMARFGGELSPTLLRAMADGVLLTPLLLLPFA